MCDIFPDVSRCCFCVSLRLGMLFVSVLAIVTGAIGLSVIEQRSKINYDAAKDVQNIKGHMDVIKKAGILISASISVMSGAFMFSGVILLIGTLWNVEAAFQVFVWVMFVSIIIGFFVLVSVALDCLVGDKCLLDHLDWLTASGFLVLLAVYLMIWFYFVSAASSAIGGAAFD